MCFMSSCAAGEFARIYCTSPRRLAISTARLSSLVLKIVSILEPDVLLKVLLASDDVV